LVALNSIVDILSVPADISQRVCHMRVLNERYIVFRERMKTTKKSPTKCKMQRKKSIRYMKKIT